MLSTLALSYMSQCAVPFPITQWHHLQRMGAQCTPRLQPSSAWVQSSIEWNPLHQNHRQNCLCMKSRLCRGAVHLWSHYHASDHAS
jgi:hypothetical protein